jgi:hypothetical protein
MLDGHKHLVTIKALFGAIYKDKYLWILLLFDPLSTGVTTLKWYRLCRSLDKDRPLWQHACRGSSGGWRTGTHWHSSTNIESELNPIIRLILSYSYRITSYIAAGPWFNLEITLDLVYIHEVIDSHWSRVQCVDREIHYLCFTCDCVSYLCSTSRRIIYTAFQIFDKICSCCGIRLVSGSKGNCNGRR